MGGLASQLHKYSVGRALSLKYNTELKLDIFWFDNISGSDTIREYHLDKYNVVAKIATEQEIKQFKPNKYLLKINNLFQKFTNWKINYRNYCNESFISLENFNLLPDNIYVEGEWSGDRYFSHIKEILQKELTLKSEYMDSTNHFLAKQSSDFAHDDNASKLHCTCSLEYYKKALQYISKNLLKMKLLIFSDDLDWLKPNFNFLDNVEFEFVEGFQDYEEFHLMTLSKHNIIANSGFSLFFAWLNINHNKIIISLSEWVFEEKLNKYIIDNIKDKNILFLENLE